MSELLPFIRRQRRPLIEPDMPKPLAPGEKCPHCGLSAPAEKPSAAAEPKLPVVAPVPDVTETPKPEASHDDTPEN